MKVRFSMLRMRRVTVRLNNNPRVCVTYLLLHHLPVNFIVRHIEHDHSFSLISLSQPSVTNLLGRVLSS